MSNILKPQPPFDRELFVMRQLRAKKRGFDNFLNKKLEEDLTERLFFAKIDQKPQFVGDYQDKTPLLASINQIQMINDVQGFLKNGYNKLEPQGFFITGFVGGFSLQELHSALSTAELELTGGVSPHIHPFIDVKTAGSLMQQIGFKRPVIDNDRFIVRYKSPLALMQELSNSGFSSILSQRSRKFMRRDVLQRAIEIYVHENSDEDGRIRATLEIIWASGYAE